MPRHQGPSKRLPPWTDRRGKEAKNGGSRNDHHGCSAAVRLLSNLNFGSARKKLSPNEISVKSVWVPRLRRSAVALMQVLEGQTMKKTAIMFLLVGFVSALAQQQANAQAITNQTPGNQGARCNPRPTT